jgi:hypothetical protein
VLDPVPTNVVTSPSASFVSTEGVVAICSATQVTTVETSLLSASIDSDIAEDRTFFVIRGELWCLFGTDAAAGTTTARIRLNGVEFLAQTGAEGNSQTEKDLHYAFSMLVQKRSPSLSFQSAVIRRMASPTAFSIPNAPTLTVVVSDIFALPVAVDFSLVTSDAGTAFDNISGYMEVVVGRNSTLFEN